MAEDKKFILKWYNKLLFKIPLVFLLLFAALVASIVLVMKKAGKARLEEQAYRLVTQTGNTIVADVYSRTVFAESLAKALANLGEQLPLDVESYMAIAPGVMDVNGTESFIAGGGIWPEPYKFSKDIERRSFFWGRDERGKFRYYDNYNDPNGAGYHNEEWYVPAKHISNDKDFWSKSYMDPYSYQPMVTCTVPMYRNGEFYGVSTVDFKLEGLGKFLEQASSRLGGYSFVVDRNGKFLSFPNEPMAKIYPIDRFGNKTEEFISVEQMAQVEPLFKPIADAISQVNEEIVKKAMQADTGKFSEELVAAIDSESYQINREEAVMINAAIADPLKNMNTNYQLKQFTTANDVILGKPCTVFIFHVPHTYWKVITVMPISEAVAASASIYHTILSLIIGITAAVILGGFVFLYVSFVKPILSMSKQLQSDVELNAGMPEHVKSDRGDELGLLAHWFNLRGDQLADTLAKLYEARNNLEKRVEERTEELTMTNKQLESEIIERKGAETQLRDSQKMLRLVMDNVPQSIFWRDRNSIYLGCNTKFAKVAGVAKPEDVIGKTDYDFSWRKEEADFYRQCDAEIMQSDTPRYHIIESQLQADGKEAWIDTNKIPLHDADGKVVGILGSFEDITERREIQNKLRQSEEKYRMIFDSANDAIFLMDSDKFIGCNDKTLEMFSCTRDQIVGREPYRFSPLTQPDGSNSMERALEKISAALAGNPQKFEWTHCKYDGTEFFAEVTLTAFVIRGKLNVLAIVRDISERKEAERQIEKSRQSLKQIINSMPFAVMVVGKDKIIRIANAAAVQLTGFNEGELVGQLCNKTLCPADKDKCPVLDQKQILDRSERKIITKDKREIPILKSVIPFKLGDEEVLLESFVDISERKKAEESMNELNGELELAVRKLEEANQDLKNFVYIASHDLREPLRKISAFGAILQKSLKGKIVDDDAENLNFMIDGASRMSKMIEGLLVYSRVGTKTHSAEKVNLNDIVKQLSELELSVSIEEKRAVIEVPQPLPEVDADPVQIRQLMQNLISNGMKYQAKDNKPQITISSQPAADGMVRINIADNGIGIAPEFQQAIFVMFKRLHSRDEYEGTGIGLAVCKKIVERHGGQIGVESEQGKGSTFWFTVPTGKKPAAIGQEATLGEHIVLSLPAGDMFGPIKNKT